MSEKDWKYYSYRGVILRYSDIKDNKYIDHQVFNSISKKWDTVNDYEGDVLKEDILITKLEVFKHIIEMNKG